MTRHLTVAVAAASILTSAIAAQPSSSAAAQSTGADPRRTFEVASIRRNTGADPGGTIRLDPGNRLSVTNISLAGLVRQAYAAQRWEMVPGGDLPSWVQAERWDIQAKAEPDAAPEHVSEMFRNLLADRFALVAKRELRQIPIYALVRMRPDGPLGPELRTSTLNCDANRAACVMRDLRGDISMAGIAWDNFPRSLSLPAGRYIVDRTGITGLVDLHLTWTPDDRAAAGAAQNDPPSLFTAVQEQLGLRLESADAPVQVLVIYSAARPKED